jgi:endonuclease III
MASILLISKLNDVEALDAYKEFEKKGVMSTESVINLKYKKLVALLNRTGHTRYDDRTALRLKNIALVLRDDYGNDLNELHFAAANERDLEKKLRNLGDGIHNSSVHIFLRELRGLWEKAEPFLPNAALFAAKNLGLTNSLSTSLALEELKSICEEGGVKKILLPNLEIALTKLGKEYCCKKNCTACPVKEVCYLRCWISRSQI